MIERPSTVRADRSGNAGHRRRKSPRTTKGRTDPGPDFEAYRGPIPDPEAFRSCETTLPGAADRILGAFELQVSPRVEPEDRWLSLHFRKDSVGQGFRLLTILAVPGLGGSLAGTGLFSVGILFSVIGLFDFSILMLRKALLFGRTPASTASARSELPRRPAQKTTTRPSANEPSD